MFEKEAEEYRKDLKSKFFLSEPQLDLACQGFKDGYNKAKEEIEAELLKCYQGYPEQMEITKGVSN